MSDYRLIHGETTRTMIRLRREGVKVNAIVTDCPYELGFMGKRWDRAGVSYRPRTWRAAYCLLPEGGRLLTFAGARTAHRITCAIEDAGFIIEDSISFLLSAEPTIRALWESLDDWQRKAFAVVLEAIAGPTHPLLWLYGSGFPKHRSKLKPAYEPIVVARKGGVSDLNIDAGRIAVSEVDRDSWKALSGFNNTPRTTGRVHANGEVTPPDDRSGYDAPGRWPANVALDEWHEQAWTLRGSIDTGIATAIREYFRAYDPVPELRDLNARSAQPSRPIQVLQPGLLRGGAVREDDGRGTPDARQETLPGIHPKDEGHADGPGAAGTGKPELAGRPAQGEGLRHGEHLRPLPGGPEAGASDGDAEQWEVRAGAPAGDGEGAGASAEIERGGPPPERGEGRQPAVELAAQGPQRAQEGALASDAGVAGASPRERAPAAKVGRAHRPDLYVLESDIPAAWLHHFQPTGILVRCGAARALDEQSGVLQSGFMAGGTRRNVLDSVALGKMNHNAASRDTFADSGGASRFFYCAKADRSERNKGLEGMPKGPPPASARSNPAPGRNAPLGVERENHHPTVKPVDLMRWLIRMVAKPGETVLDPFMGSGTTGVAATLEGVHFVGIEREAEYLDIARLRIANTQPSLFGAA